MIIQDFASFADDTAVLRYDVAIIGSGFSGSMLAVHLSHTEAPPKVALIERSHRFGPGLAYGAAAAEHLLNVPAGKMSAFPDQPSHFLDWAQSHLAGTGVTADTFLPRLAYGRYLTELLTAAARRNRELELIDGEAVDVEPLPEGGFLVHFAHGGRLLAQNVVLTWGNLPPTTPARLESDPGAGKRFVDNPWSADAREALARPGDILIIGSGLTCLDLLATADRMGRSGRIHVLSRHGLFPEAHRPGSPRAPFLTAGALPGNLRELFRMTRAEAVRAAGEGADWRAVVDSIRPFTQDLWAGLPIKERQRFLRHVRSLWETLRHRAAPEMRAVKDVMEERGQLLRCRGKLARIHCLDDCVEAEYRPRGGKDLVCLRVEAVINATGPEANPRRAQSALLGNLLKRGLAQPDPLGLGIEVTGAPAAAGKDPLHTVGSLRKGSLWESTAVPELRVQAAQLAQLLLESRESTAQVWSFDI